MRFLRSLLGTLVAVLAGWLAGVLAVAVIYLTGAGGAQRDAAVGGILFTGLFMLYFIVPIWIVFLIPLYWFVPSSSLLWRPYVCVSLGIVVGVAIVVAFTGAELDAVLWSMYLLAAVVGGVTCLTGVLTRDRFHRPSNPYEECQRG